jgi:hypothetical protein
MRINNNNNTREGDLNVMGDQVEAVLEECLMGQVEINNNIIKDKEDPNIMEQVVDLEGYLVDQVETNKDIMEVEDSENSRAADLENAVNIMEAEEVAPTVASGDLEAEGVLVGLVDKVDKADKAGLGDGKSVRTE